MIFAASKFHIDLPCLKTHLAQCLNRFKWGPFPVIVAPREAPLTALFFTAEAGSVTGGAGEGHLSQG